MEDLSLHILDIAENSISVGAKNIEIVIVEDISKDIMTLEINDDGKGMTPDVVKAVINPFYTTRTTRKVGLGLAFLDEAAKTANGRVEIQSSPAVGTKVKATFQISHIDRKPLGDMAATITMLVAGNPGINFTYRYEHDGQTFAFDTKEIKARLHGLDLNCPDTLMFIRDYITEHTASCS